MKRVVCLSRRNFSSEILPQLRLAQATELFRSKYLISSRAPSSVSVADLDDLVAHHRVRPSVFIGMAETVGAGLGMAARILPESMKKEVSIAVEDASSRVLNDIVRDLQDDSEEVVAKSSGGSQSGIREEVRETVKYHRDIGRGPAAEGQGMIQQTLTTAIYSVLKVSAKL